MTPSGDFTSAPHPNAAPPLGRVPLSVGLSPGRKALVVTLSVVSLVVLLPLGIIVGSAVSEAALAAVAVGVPVILGILGLLLLSSITWAVCRVVRYGAHLDGTTLVLYTAFRKRRADLASAKLLQLSMSQDGWSGRSIIPTLDVFNDAQNRSVTAHFSLARQGFLPYREVQALTAAIQSGARSGLPSQRAEYTVQELLRIVY